MILDSLLPKLDGEQALSHEPMRQEKAASS